MYDIVCAARYYPRANDLCLDLMPNYLGSLNTLGFYTANDFAILGKNLGLNDSQIQIQFRLLKNMEAVFISLIDRSFLPEDEKITVKAIMQEQYRKFTQGRID